MIFLNIGSNLSSMSGSRKENIISAINHIENIGTQIIKKSSYYETPSYPDKSKPKFLNICIKAKSKTSPEDFLKKILLIEKKIGRIRKEKNEPRVCDIDIIDFNGLIINSNSLTIPHPESHLRNFVIYPLKEIEPDWVHPIFNKKIDSFFLKLDKNSHNEITRLGKSDII